MFLNALATEILSLQHISINPINRSENTNTTHTDAAKPEIRTNPPFSLIHVE